MKLNYQIFLRISLVATLGLILVLPTNQGRAQEGTPSGPVYIVQAGDSLWDIALRFRVSMDELARVNGINDPSQLTAGAQLTIPGLEGIQGILTTKSVPYGESLRSLSRRYQASVETLVKLNHLTSPTELFAGTTLVIPEPGTATQATKRSSLIPGQSLLEMAAIDGTNPWSYILHNGAVGSWSIVPGDVLQLPVTDSSQQSEEQPGALPKVITGINLAPSPFVQGKAAQIKIQGEPGLTLTGELNDHELNFFSDKEGVYFSLQGIHAMTDPGLYQLTITGTLPAEAPYSNTPFSFSQAVVIQEGGYPFDPVLTVSPETIDPAVTRPEDAQWAALSATATPQKLWDGIFKSPAPDEYSTCWPSMFGSRRSYNGSAYDYFHTGLDFCGGVGTEVRAPAAGKVVFAGPLTVRGNAIMIDHGWGIYTGYMHLSEILIKAGEAIEAGQLIGLVGGTGRVTGPHLHWEVWAGDVQVDPLDWLVKSYPE